MSMRIFGLACAPIGALALYSLAKYPGQWSVYLLFTLTANALLFFGFRRRAIFFDAFIGVFFWLGFWLKLSVRVAFLDGRFHVAVGHFDGSGAAFDRALLAASCAFIGLLAASALRSRLFTYPASPPERSAEGLLAFYARYRKAVLVSFVLLVVAAAVSNLLLGIYQRGTVPRTVLPYGLGGVYSWLLLFGLASFCAVIVSLEFRLKRSASYSAVAVSLFEGFMSNVSLLSRGMVLNVGALGYGAMKALKQADIRAPLRFWVISMIAFALLFACSVMLVNYLRVDIGGPADFARKTFEATRATTPLFLDRWVGMEGVMAVSSHPQQGWDLWREAWKEVQSPGQSFYDLKLIAAPYADTDRTKYQSISLPGIVAFFYYPGSLGFLAACMFLLGALGAAIEYSVYRLGAGNLVLCALLAQVIASRYVHFGYAPRQSYLLLGALYLNLLLIYLSDKALSYRRA